MGGVEIIVGFFLEFKGGGILPGKSFPLNPLKLDLTLVINNLNNDPNKIKKELFRLV